MIPLYDIAARNVSKRQADRAALDILLMELSKCSSHEMEIVYGLILSYCEAEGIPITYYPFEAKQTLEGIEFNIRNMPVKLQNILNKFVCKIRCHDNKECR